MPPQSLQSLGGQLPKNVFTVSRYWLHMIPLWESSSLGRLGDESQGQVVIDLELLRPTQVLDIHSTLSKINSAYLQQRHSAQTKGPEPNEKQPLLLPHSKKNSYAASVSEANAKWEYVRLNFGRLVPAGSYSLIVHFTGKIGSPEHSYGFYKTDPGRSILGLTQFEPVFARSAFPCFDEPKLKAIFQFSMTLPKLVLKPRNAQTQQEQEEEEEEEGGEGEGKEEQEEAEVWTITTETEEDTQKQTAHKQYGLQCWSNTSLQGVLLDPARPSWETWVFKETPKMSTYLLAWVIGFADKVSAKVGDVEVNIQVPPGHEALAQHALFAATTSLQFFNDYFQFDYGKEGMKMDKVDLVAVPNFKPAAMENWGCITFLDNYLMHDDAKDDIKHRRDVALVVAHELAHQWVGNLVTADWWEYLWLHEAFATYMAHAAIEHEFPELTPWTEFLSTRKWGVMSMDKRESLSRPIETNVLIPANIHDIFDPIVYSKGAAVVRMMEKFFTDDVFKDGMRRYIKQNAFASATNDHFYESLQGAVDDKKHATKYNVKHIMGKWMKNPGFPVLKVEKQRGDETVIVTQTSMMDSSSSSSTLWPIPLRSDLVDEKTKERASFRVLLDDKKRSTHMSTPAKMKQSCKHLSSDSLWLLNADDAGYFLIQYGEDWEHHLLDHIAHLTPSEQTGLLGSVYFLASSGKVATGRLLKAAAALAADGCPTACLRTALILKNVARIFPRYKKAIATMAQAALSRYKDKMHRMQHTMQTLRRPWRQWAGAYATPFEQEEKEEREEDEEEEGELGVYEKQQQSATFFDRIQHENLVCCELELQLELCESSDRVDLTTLSLSQEETALLQSEEAILKAWAEHSGTLTSLPSPLRTLSVSLISKSHPQILDAMEKKSGWVSAELSPSTNPLFLDWWKGLGTEAKVPAFAKAPMTNAFSTILLSLVSPQGARNGLAAVQLVEMMQAASSSFLIPLLFGEEEQLFLKTTKMCSLYRPGSHSKLTQGQVNLCPCAAMMRVLLSKKSTSTISYQTLRLLLPKDGPLWMFASQEYERAQLAFTKEQHWQKIGEHDVQAFFCSDKH